MAKSDTEVMASLIPSRECSPDQHLMKLLDRLCLFIVNTVFAMQFNSPLLISQDDLLVACS